MHPTEEGNEAPEAAREMPRYRSHKEVWALEIATVDPVTCKVAFREEGYAPVKLPADMWSRYKPISGDFYVQYADGYKAFSPRKAFLEGYTAVGQSFRDIKQEIKDYASVQSRSAQE